jgi:hypothetical protein
VRVAAGRRSRNAWLTGESVRDSDLSLKGEATIAGFAATLRALLG